MICNNNAFIYYFIINSQKHTRTVLFIFKIIEVGRKKNRKLLIELI